MGDSVVCGVDGAMFGLAVGVAVGDGVGLSDGLRLSDGLPVGSGVGTLLAMTN